MSQITRVPLGLQDFLGTQNQGKNPVDLLQAVQPTVDFDKFLSIELDKWIRQAFSPTAIDTQVSIPVPNGELWLVKSVGVEAVFGGGAAPPDSFRYTPTLVDIPNSSSGSLLHPFLPSKSVFILNATTERRDSTIAALPQLAWGGSEIRVMVENVDLTAGAINGSFFVNYDRLRY